MRATFLLCGVKSNLVRTSTEVPVLVETDITNNNKAPVDTESIDNYSPCCRSKATSLTVSPVFGLRKNASV